MASSAGLVLFGRVEAGLTTRRSYLVDRYLGLLGLLPVALTSRLTLGWLAAQPGVSTPIASARTVEQLEEIVNIAKLSADEIAELTELTR